MMMVVMMPAHPLRQILNVGQLAALRGVRKVGGELVELGRGRRITLRLGSRGGACQVRGDLRGNLLILGGIRLLKLLECGQDLGQGRKLGAIALLRGRRRDYAARTVAGFVGCQASVLQATENGLQITISRECVHRNAAHASLIGNSVATLRFVLSY